MKRVLALAQRNRRRRALMLVPSGFRPSERLKSARHFFGVSPVWKRPYFGLICFGAEMNESASWRLCSAIALRACATGHRPVERRSDHRRRWRRWRDTSGPGPWGARPAQCRPRFPPEKSTCRRCALTWFSTPFSFIEKHQFPRPMKRPRNACVPIGAARRSIGEQGVLGWYEPPEPESRLTRLHESDEIRWSFAGDLQKRAG